MATAAFRRRDSVAVAVRRSRLQGPAPHQATYAGGHQRGDDHPWFRPPGWEATRVDAGVENSGSGIDVYGVSTRATFALGAAALTLTVRRLVLYEPGIADAEDLVTPELGERFDALLATGDGGSSGGPAPAAGSSAPTGSAPVGCGGRPTGPAPQRLVTHRLAGCLSDVMGTKVDRLVLAELSDPDRLGRLGVERFRRFVARRDVRVRTEVAERVARRDVRVSTEVAERLVTADGHGPAAPIARLATASGRRCGPCAYPTPTRAGPCR